MNQTLHPSDIFGKLVREIYRSEWDEDPDGYAGCSVFVEIEGDVLFELQGVDFGDIVPILRINPPTVKLFSVEDRISSQCRGRAVLDILASDQWPTIGVLLSDGKILLASDDCSPRRVGPCVLKIDSVYKKGDYISYWSQRAE